MEIRNILLASFIELDNGVHKGVPLDVLEKRVSQRSISPQDFEINMASALHEGHFQMVSPGIVGLTPAGMAHYRHMVER